MIQNNQEFLNIASNIKLLILDVDGVLTDGKIVITSSGDEIKYFSVQDGYGMVALQKQNIPIAIITARNSHAVTVRMQDLGVKHVYQGQRNKSEAFLELLQIYEITADSVAYMGDDIPDLTVMSQVGLPIAVANAMPKVKQITKWHTYNSGGSGAVREVCDALIEAKQQTLETKQTQTLSELGK